MNFLFLVLLAAATPVFAEMPVAEASAGKTAAPDMRPRIYELAGVLGNEGLKFRDGAWTGSLRGSKPQRLVVNLFAGNQYWFVAATSEPGDAPLLSLRDPSGRAVELVSYEKDGTAAAGVTAGVTGRYTLEIKGATAGTREFSLLYLFK